MVDVQDQVDRAIAEVRGELARMDAKAATMFGWCGTGGTIGAAALGQTHLPLLPLALCWSAVALMGGAAALLAWAIRPRLTGGHGLMLWASMRPDQITEAVAQASGSGPATLVWLSRRARAGFRRIQIATDLLVAAPVLAACALLVVGATR